MYNIETSVHFASAIISVFVATLHFLNFPASKLSSLKLGNRHQDQFLATKIKISSFEGYTLGSIVNIAITINLCIHH